VTAVGAARAERAGAVITPGLSMGNAESGTAAPLVERIGRWASATINP
jgi:hypothetical protein